ncbi:hypothetical protein OAU49_00525 [Alphaproteobacteria bacterium]|nr:hypothetical protein [Alphaproteobacteria bacterium]MDC3273107.1 hypothetical protein [Alphaproteobacteria bacterium]
MSDIKKIKSWLVRYEVTFYGNNPERGSFREVKEDSIIISEDIDIKNKVSFDTKDNVEINFLLWVDKLPIEKLTKVPHDYNETSVRYDEESIEVLSVTRV